MTTLIRLRKIYAGYYRRYDRQAFYVVTEATDYNTGEETVIMQEYSLVSTKPYITMPKRSFCEMVALPDGRIVDKFTRDPSIHVSDYFIDCLEQKGLRGPIRHNKQEEESEYTARSYQSSQTYYEYAKDIIDHYIVDRKRLDLCLRTRRLIGLRDMDDFRKLKSDVLFFERMMQSFLSGYHDFFDDRFRKKQSIRRYAAEHNLNRGSVNYLQKKFYAAFAEQLSIRDKADNTCRLLPPLSQQNAS